MVARHYTISEIAEELREYLSRIGKSKEYEVGYATRGDRENVYIIPILQRPQKTGREFGRPVALITRKTNPSGTLVTRCIAVDQKLITESKLKTIAGII